MSSPLGAVPFAIVDVETTGFSPLQHDRVVEIAVVRMTLDDGILGMFSTLVNPQRDVGPTHVHGITATDVAGAPSFSDVAGDVVALLGDAVLAGHNVRFDLGFLAAEFRHAGHEMPPMPSVCTLRLAGALRPGLASRKLCHCCEDAGISYDVGTHTALGDALATTQLLAHYLMSARQAGRTLEELGCRCGPVVHRGWCSACPSGRLLARDAARARRKEEQRYLATLIGRLPPSPFSDPDEASYLELLDRCLEDRRVTDEEADGLFRSASEWGLTRAAVFEVHHRYLEALVRTALLDGVVTEQERADLDLVAGLLGLHPSAVDQAVRTATANRPEPPPTPARPKGSLSGQSVCFTGALSGSVGGQPLTRDLAEKLVADSGLFVRKGVTKGLDILVAADAESQSGKARKAREYGVRIMVPAAFWRALGVQIEDPVAS